MTAIELLAQIGNQESECFENKIVLLRQVRHRLRLRCDLLRCDGVERIARRRINQAGCHVASGSDRLTKLKARR